MNKSFIGTILCCFLGIIGYEPLYAQSTSDTLSTHAAFNKVTDNFYKSIGQQSHLYNGREYDYYPSNIKGNAYLMDVNVWSPGSVDYDGYLYKNVNMLYDINKDELVILLYNKVTKISLLTERIKSFDLLGHHFIYIQNNPLSNNSVNTGFYDQLYAGNIKLLVKRSKSIQNSSSSQTIETYFSPSTDYYLYKNGGYYKVNSKGSFMDVLKDKKKELQQFIKSNNISINKKDREQAMVKLAEYYDHLTE
jgi:hypothetical protein